MSEIRRLRAFPRRMGSLHPQQATDPVQGRRHMDIEVRVDPAGDHLWHARHRHPFSLVRQQEVARTCRDGEGQDNDGPLRQVPSKSPRPTGGCRVGDQARPTDQYPDDPKASAGNTRVRPGPDTHPTLTPTTG